MMNRDFTFGGECIIQCTNDVLQNCAPETCIILLTSVIPKYSIKRKINTRKREKKVLGFPTIKKMLNKTKNTPLHSTLLHFHPKVFLLCPPAALLGLRAPKMNPTCPCGQKQRQPDKSPYSFALPTRKVFTQKCSKARTTFLGESSSAVNFQEAW